MQLIDFIGTLDSLRINKPSIAEESFISTLIAVRHNGALVTTSPIFNDNS